MSKFGKSLGATATVLVVLGIIIAGYIVLTSLFNPRIDLTEEKIHTLSDGTKDILKGLERPVTLKFYCTKGNKDIPSFIKVQVRQLEDMLRQYDRIGGDKLYLEEYDPKPDTEEEDWAQRKYNLRPYNVGGENVFVGLAAVSGPNEESIPAFDFQQSDTWEYEISRLITSVGEKTSPVIGLISSLPVMGTPQQPQFPGQPPPPQQPKWQIITYLESQFEIRDLGTTVENIDEDIDMVMAIHPKGLSEKTLLGLDQYVLGGGRLVAFLDPRSRQESNTSQPQFRGMIGMGGSDLNDLTKAWGITMADGKIAADTNLKSFDPHIRQFLMGVLAMNKQTKTIDDKAIASRDLGELDLHFAGAFEGEPAEGLEMITYLTTTDAGGLLPESEAMSAESKAKDSLEKEGKLPVALRLTGTFKSAFPEGVSDMTDEEKAALKKEGEGGMVTLVADSDLLVAEFALKLVRTPFGMMRSQNSNLDFVLNLVEENIGNPNLIGLRTRGKLQRGFDRVEAIEKQAREDSKAEEEKLQERINDINEELTKLAEQSKNRQEFFSSSEVQEAEKKANKELMKFNKELREVRRGEREAVESLGTKLKALNIAAVPVAVALFGLVRLVSRRRRSNR